MMTLRILLALSALVAGSLSAPLPQPLEVLELAQRVGETTESHRELLTYLHETLPAESRSPPLLLDAGHSPHGSRTSTPPNSPSAFGVHASELDPDSVFLFPQRNVPTRGSAVRRLTMLEEATPVESETGSARVGSGWIAPPNTPERIYVATVPRRGKRA